MKRFKKAIVIILLCCLSVSLGGAICARAAISDDVGVRWWRMNKAHEGAEIARALGGITPPPSLTLTNVGRPQTTNGKS